MNNADMPAMAQANNEVCTAFNELEQEFPNGLTKREHFAGLALQGLLSNPNSVISFWAQEEGSLATVAANHADALLAELEK